MIGAIKDYLSSPSHELSLVVDNTKHLLQMLDENQLDFAVIEGTFSVDGLTQPHAFHVVYTRNTNARKYAERFLGDSRK